MHGGSLQVDVGAGRIGHADTTDMEAGAREQETNALIKVPQETSARIWSVRRGQTLVSKPLESSGTNNGTEEMQSQHRRDGSS